MKKIIETSHAPAAIGAYSQACQIDNLLFISGQIGLCPQSQKLVSDTCVRAQLEQALQNLQAVCEAAQTHLENIVKLNIYLLDMTDFPIVNELVQKYFKKPFPARAVVAVAGLPKNAKVELDAVAAI